MFLSSNTKKFLVVSQLLIRCLDINKRWVVVIVNCVCTTTEKIYKNITKMSQIKFFILLYFSSVYVNNEVEFIL